MFLAEKGIDVPLVQVNLREEEQLGDAFRKINPDCTVPVLELNDGTRISEVFAICLYLESQHPEPVLMGRNPVEQATVSMWNTKIEQNGIAAVAETRGRTRVQAFLERMDGQLDANTFITGDQFTMADITAFVTVEFAQRLKIPTKDSQQNLQLWFDAVSKRPSTRA
jgi:glutathione S-transferase